MTEASGASGAGDASDHAPAPAADRPTGAPAGEPAGSADPPARDARAAEGAASAKPGRPIRIELEASRQRSIGWTIFYLVVGVLLIQGLGTVGVWVGIALVAMGVYHAARLARSLMYPPGTIVVSEREIVLPRGPNRPRPVVVSPKDVTAIYFLRRSVPWNRAAPVLIVELGAKAMVFPRNWFASEADQRHVIHAVLRSKGETPQASTSSDPDAA